MEALDVPLVCALDARCQGHPWNPVHFLEEISRGDLGHARVLEDRQRRIVGYICTWVVCDEMHVGTLGVDPDLRCQGLGRSLVQGAHSWAIGQGAAIAHLEVRAHNAAALALYASLGYRRVGIRSGYYPDNGEDAHLLLCDLAAPFAGTSD
jgi:ribosomal-protein-alanine N-acetyltransferase